MNKIEFVREGVTVYAEDGANLLEVMRKAGLHPDAPCGGTGKCGKCQVILLSKNGQELKAKVKSCQTKVDGDYVVDSLIADKKMEILTSGDTDLSEFDPLVEAREVKVLPCPAGHSISDWTRFAEAADRGHLIPDPAIASRIGRLQREGDGTMWAIFAGHRVLAVQKEQPEFFTAAFDIGTTTIAGYLLNGTTGQEAAVTSRLNPQAQFGADVINRANYAINHGMEEVTHCIRVAIDEMIGEMAEKAGASREQIYAVSVVGNTCMHHLFLGVDVDSLVHAPYNPAVEEPMVLRAPKFGLRINENALLYMLPNIAGFVGADTVACLVSSDLAEQKDWTLLIDIGTNGEMVLAKNHDMIACSTAAGPAFEGAGITHGMRGSEGAISKVRWCEDHWEYETVFDKKPKGICGSGLLDMVSELLVSGQMDESGEMLCGKSIVLATAEESGTGAPVTLEQKDVRELQLAKAAIASGVHLLAAKKGIDVSEITEVWLAGAFGSFLSPKSACNIGLIPEVLRGRIKAIGNAAGEGAKRVLREKNRWKLAGELSRKCDFLELAGMPEFQDRFVDELEFPELD